MVRDVKNGLRPERSFIAGTKKARPKEPVMTRIVARDNDGTKPFGSYAGYPVADLLRTALHSLPDCDRADAEFLQKLAAARPTELPLAELKWLVGICRHVARKPLPRFDLALSEAGEALSTARLAVLRAS
jgi:hypothetical protein